LVYILVKIENKAIWNLLNLLLHVPDYDGTTICLQMDTQLTRMS